MSFLIFIPILLGIISALVLNYLADVLPSTLRLSHPVCWNKECGETIPWKDYLLLRRCKKCGRRRSLRTFVIIGLCIISAGYLWFQPPARLGFALGFLGLIYLILIAIIDLEHRLVLLPLSITGFILTGITGFIMHGWKSSLIGGVFGFGVMFLFYLLGGLVTRGIAKKKHQDVGEVEETFGSGDVTLATILGLFLGWPLIWFGLLLGVLILAVFIVPMAVVMVIRRRSKERELTYVPIGPPFILSAILLVYLPTWISYLLPR
jgi:leader peptidase (prepilin peptidase) / N-methyltransferase